MDWTRRSTRHLDQTDNSPRTSASDSGRGSLITPERASTGANVTSSGASPSLSRDTPLDDDVYENGHERPRKNESIRIERTVVFGGKCFEQACVSHVDHPTAFFLQLAQFESRFEKLHAEINEYYSKNTKNNPSRWKRGDYCVARFTDNKFYRARIIDGPDESTTPNRYYVVYVDFGNRDEVTSPDIHLLLPRFAELSAQAVPCSLNKTLPPDDFWKNHPEAVAFFKELVLDKYVDATFQLKTPRDWWPFSFVELEISCPKKNVRQSMKDAGHLREASNEQICIELGQSFTPDDRIIYNISHEDDDDNTDEDYD